MKNRTILLTVSASLAIAVIWTAIHFGGRQHREATVAPDQHPADLYRGHDVATDAQANSPPVTYRFNKSVATRPANSYQELLARYNHDERVLIESFYAEYGGAATALGTPRFHHAFDFHTQQQFTWLVANGYPTPDDVLAADRMTDGELAEAARSGNFKANVFYLARLQAQSSELTNSSMDDVLRSGASEVGIAMQVFRSGSPFGAIAYSRWADSANHPELAAASLSFARQLGDSRKEFLDGYITLHPNIDPATLANAYELILALTRRSPSLRDMDAVARKPRFPLER